MIPGLLGWVLAAGGAQAALPLPDYAEEAVVAVWHDLDGRIAASCRWPGGDPHAGNPPVACDVEALDAAVAFGRHALDTLGDEGRLHYLIGLAHRYAGRLDDARRAQRAATEAAPDRAEGWMERGELAGLDGDWATARDAFERVVAIRPDGPAAWVGWFSLAQAEAWLGEAEAMEGHLREALRRGFSFRLVADHPVWRGFFADPTLGPVLERLVTVYASDDVRERLRAPLPPPG